MCMCFFCHECMRLGPVPAGLDFNVALHQEKMRDKHRQAQEYRQRRLSDTSVLYLKLKYRIFNDYSMCVHRLDRKQQTVFITKIRNHFNINNTLVQVFSITVKHMHLQYYFSQELQFYLLYKCKDHVQHYWRYVNTGSRFLQYDSCVCIIIRVLLLFVYSLWMKW